MKGFIIYETPLWGNEENVVYAQEVGYASYTLKQIGSDITCYLEGTAKGPVTKASCNKEDTYDFETGALISLMKKCGVDKVVRACNEAFSEDTFKTYATMYERELNTLKKEKEQIIVAKNVLYNKLKKENEELHKNIDELFESEQHSKTELGRLYFEKHRLEEKVEKLTLDCEKLQHGYNDINILFCGGRQNGKQHTLLVDLFKKIPKETIQAAYVVAYKESLIWSTSQPTIRESITVDSLIEQSRAFRRKCVDEWLYGPPTKREEMWDDILACEYEHSKCVKVKKEDLETFVKECNEKKIFNIIGQEFLPREYWFDDDACIFQIFRKPAGFICAERLCYAFKDTVIDYLPPMRWDLFKKGRIAVRLTKDNYKEFYDICEKELGRSPSYKPDEFAYAPMEKFVLRYDKKFKGYIFLGSTESKKIVNWEDVR